MTDDAHLHTPRRLASWASGEIELHADTLEWLGNLPGPLCVLAIAGPLRSGKSCLMNHLFGAAGGEAFRVGGTIVSTTHGMWICAARPGCLPGVDGTVLLLDTEGLGALESDSPQREPQLFALTALLSSVVLYNSFGLVSDRAVERLAQLAAVASQCLETDAAGAVGRAQLLWILRDFHLELVDEGGAPLTADAYLEDELAATDADANADADASLGARARSVLRSLFPSRGCVPLPRPAESEEELASLPLEAAAAGGAWAAALDALRAKLGAALRPKRIGGWTLDGKGLAQLAEETVRTLQGGGLPDAPALCRAVVHAQAERALRLSLQAYRSSWAAHAPRMPLPEAELTAVHRGAKEAARAQLHELAPLATASSPGRWRSYSAGSPVRRGAADEIDAALAQAVEGQRRQWLALNGERAAERCAARLDAATHALLRAALPPGARPPGTAGISAYEAVLRAEAPPVEAPPAETAAEVRERERIVAESLALLADEAGGGGGEEADGWSVPWAAVRDALPAVVNAAWRAASLRAAADARRAARKHAAELRRAQQSATEATAAAQAARSRSLGLGDTAHTVSTRLKLEAVERRRALSASKTNGRPSSASTPALGGRGTPASARVYRGADGGVYSRR